MFNKQEMRFIAGLMVEKLLSFPNSPLSIPTEDKCPICGRIIDRNFDYCWFCHQKFYELGRVPESNDDVLFISITTFIGWVGSGPSYHIAINVVLKDYTAIKVKSGDTKESAIYLSKRLIKQLCKNYKQLFHCKEIEENRIQANDSSIYYN